MEGFFFQNNLEFDDRVMYSFRFLSLLKYRIMPNSFRGGSDCMMVGFATYTISACHH